jgi:hypothetical protein
MKAPAPAPRPYLWAGALFAACVGIMVALANTEPPKKAVRPETTSEELDAPREIQGVPCKGYAALGADGTLLGCILARDHAFGAVTLPANTQIRSFHPNSVPKDMHPGANVSIDGHICIGTGPGNWMAGLHPNGRLAYCFLAQDETINGVPCRHGSFWGEVTGGVIVRFHDNGSLASCRLAADVTIGGQQLKKGQRVNLDPNGTIEKPQATR